MSVSSVENPDVFIPKQVQDQDAEIEKHFNTTQEVDDSEPEADDNTEEAEPTTNTSQLDEEELKYRDRYLVLQGKYNAEVPRIAAELQELRSYIAEQAALEAERKLNPQINNNEPATDPLSELKEEYSEDFVEKIQYLINQTVQKQIEPLAATTQQKIATVEDTQIASARAAFKAELSEKVPNWEALVTGQDKNFIEFANKLDPTGLYTYGQLIQSANDNWDIDRMAAILQNYNSQTQAPQKESITKQKQAMIAPSRSTTSSNTVPNESGKIWTASEIIQFQIDDRKGKYDDETSKRMYADLLAASSEGRIRG